LFKQYGEVNSVKKHNYEYMAKWWCLLAMEKQRVSAYSGHLQVLTTLLLKEISTSPRGLGILYKTLLTTKLSKLEDGCHRPKHVVFPLLTITII